MDTTIFIVKISLTIRLGTRLLKEIQFKFYQEFYKAYKNKARRTKSKRLKNNFELKTKAN